MIAKEFSETDKVNKDSNEITFIKYMWFEGGLFLLHFLNNQQKNQTQYFTGVETTSNVENWTSNEKKKIDIGQNRIEDTLGEAKNLHYKRELNKLRKSIPVNEHLKIVNRSGADASGHKKDDGTFVVHKGSKISENEAPKLKTSASKAYKLRRELKSVGTIDENGFFKKDYMFNSVSLAAKVILGTSADGSQWKKG